MQEPLQNFLQDKYEYDKDKNIVNAVQTNIEYIKTETLTEELEITETVNNGIEIAFDEVNTKLFIKKH